VDTRIDSLSASADLENGENHATFFTGETGS
jgi:hypothetical protein